MNSTGLVLLAVGAVVAVGGGILRKWALGLQDGSKFKKIGPKLGTLLTVAGAWLMIVQLLGLIFGPAETEALKVEISPERTILFGLSISSTVVTTWISMLVIIAGAVLIRLIIVPRMTDVPSRFQNVLEIMIEQIDKYTKSQAGDLGQNLSAYLFSVAVLLVGCAFVELFGVRAPTADITMTFALAFVTFILINYYGIKRKGAVGRVKALGEQGPIVLVLRVISDCAIPVSMACRLFGNMLGGMIVMDLIYSALGGAAVGIPSVLGLYFNVFHPLIQAFIFITLTLTFINEAVE